MNPTAESRNSAHDSEKSNSGICHTANLRRPTRPNSTSTSRWQPSGFQPRAQLRAEIKDSIPEFQNPNGTNSQPINFFNFIYKFRLSHPEFTIPLFQSSIIPSKPETRNLKPFSALAPYLTSGTPWAMSYFTTALILFSICR